MTEDGFPEIYQKDGSDGYCIDGNIDSAFIDWIEKKTGVVKDDEFKICCIVAKDCKNIREQLDKKFQERNWNVVPQRENCWTEKDINDVIHRVRGESIGKVILNSKERRFILTGWDISDLAGKQIELSTVLTNCYDKEKQNSDKKVENKESHIDDKKIKNNKPKVYTRKIKKVILNEDVGQKQTKYIPNKIPEQKQDATFADVGEFFREERRNDVDTIRND
ncbi:MAG: hypothetical protein MJ048_00560 [Acidaminococcaceae bacterium]|nr:hypothetical protein [Acidaminococcaceae bacterium]